MYWRKKQNVCRIHLLYFSQVFDPTESAGLGLLNEMSLVETKARLEANERRRVKAEAVRRNEILLERAEREADLIERCLKAVSSGISVHVPENF